MLENLRRKSLSNQYVDLDNHFFFKQGHAMYNGTSAISIHHQHLQGKNLKASFEDSYDLVGNYYQVKESIKNFSNTSSKIQFNMNFCPKGQSILKKDDDTPIQTISVNSFLLAEHEITQELYQNVMDSNPSAKDSVGSKLANQYPVENLTWYEAIEFCNKLSEIQGFEKCYTLENVVSEKISSDPMKPFRPKTRIKSADVLWDRTKNGYRLPQVKEWKWAAKASTENQWSGTNLENELTDYAWYEKNSQGKTQPIKKKLPNGWGFYDMSGNVEEWCWDSKQITNTATNKAEEQRSIRGGSAKKELKAIKINQAKSELPTYTNSHLGFRVARTPYISDVALSVSIFGKAW